MRRHLVVLLALAVATTAACAYAQEPGRVYRLGILFRNETGFDLVRAVTLPELARQGFVEGRNLTLDLRTVPVAQTAAAVLEMVAGRPDVVITADFDAVRALSSASPSLPILMSFISDDPVASGLVDSLRRPGGRITGQMILSDELEAKRLTMLIDAIPSLRRIAVLAPDPPRNPLSEAALGEAATRRGVSIVFVRAGSADAFRDAIARSREAGAEALLISTFAGFSSNASNLAALAIAARLPTVCQWSTMARAGCLLGYGPSQRAIRLRTADYVARIFRGADPGEMPIEQPAVFELAVNLRTARALGITISPALLAIADEVIE